MWNTVRLSTGRSLTTCRPPLIHRRIDFRNALAYAIAERHYSIAQNQVSVADQLRRVADLQRRVATVNSKSAKQEIIAEYPDLRHLLECVYQHDRRNHLSFSTIQKYITSQPDPDRSSPSPSSPNQYPTSITELLGLLASKTVTGNEAKDVTVSFLAGNGVLGEEELMETFGRLLDRNLVVGFGGKTLEGVKWELGNTVRSEVGNIDLKRAMDHAQTQGADGSTSSHVSSSVSPPSSQNSRMASLRSNASSSSDSEKTPILPNFGNLEKLEVALGKSIEPPFDKLFSKSSAPWYASRKLDGVRCLTFLDFLIPDLPSDNKDHPLQVVSIHFVSRSGKPFSCLGRLEEQLVLLGQMPQMRERLVVDPEIVERRDGGVVKRLVLDGEICVMRPKSESETTTTKPRDDGSAISAIWTSDDSFVEDFPSTVSAMRRSIPIPHLSYFVFDVLPWAEVRGKQALHANPELRRKFSQRIEDIRLLRGWLNDKLEKEGVQEKVVKDLMQCQVGSVEELEGMVKRAADEGWEGLILRADGIYKGKRSTDIRKFKKWQDAEYIVKSLDTSTMRLAIDGTFAEHEAMSNVWIEHDGHPVSVGSGFTAEQRLRYAKHPEEIVGRMMTVEYFSESEKVGREDKRSLRFPRCKMVWEEGKRGM
ncbi:hypothetical protein IAR55_004728 [Kwoniella newhampshirensis]|uniref:ATP-dependent DNA ligase family profile domain-containing protein n=1 Tax=Kwoniella newhampshirensis TaxID=1651941 RepID=A0AAW0YLN6_9TREE